MVQVNSAIGGAESFEKILSDKAQNKKWINFARKELRGNKKSGYVRHKEAEDYVEDAKLKILSGEGLPDEGIRNIDTYVCGFIKKEICAELKTALVMIPISSLKEREYSEEEIEENGSGGNVSEGDGVRVEENLIVSFEDPFEVKLDKIGAFELMQNCYAILEKEEPEMLIIFDERAKGHPNRDIAKYLSLDVSEIEKIWKRILRLLRKHVSIRTFL